MQEDNRARRSRDVHDLCNELAGGLGGTIVDLGNTHIEAARASTAYASQWCNVPMWPTQRPVSCANVEACASPARVYLAS